MEFGTRGWIHVEAESEEEARSFLAQPIEVSLDGRRMDDRNGFLPPP
jgi:hypothetical protein